MVIPAIVFTAALIGMMSLVLICAIGSILAMFDNPDEQLTQWFGVAMCLCICLSYIGVLTRIIGPIYRFFLGGV